MKYRVEMRVPRIKQFENYTANSTAFNTVEQAIERGRACMNCGINGLEWRVVDEIGRPVYDGDLGPVDDVKPEPVAEPVVAHNFLRDAMYNFAFDSGASDEYCRGMVVGVVTGLVATGIEFSVALKLVRESMPKFNVRHNAEELFPEFWSKS